MAPAATTRRPAAIEPRTEAPAERERSKEEQRAEDALRPLDPWKRYRALVDAIDEGHQVLEIADRKTRFALLIMGALNVFTFVVVTRPELLALIPSGLRGWLGAYVVIYSFLAIFFLLQAIEALRPIAFAVRLGEPGEDGRLQSPMKVRHYEYAIERDVEAHGRAWREVCLDQLNAEMAVQHHLLVRTNQHKYAALHRLYAGLYVLTLMSGALIAVLVLLGATGGGRRGGPALRLHSPGAVIERPLVRGGAAGTPPRA